tara:strand:+ start:18715 stop:18855 length:141 start_codon:yes stop_codon:yes gene_type:complete
VGGIGDGQGDGGTFSGLVISDLATSGLAPRADAAAGAFIAGVTVMN